MSEKVTNLKVNGKRYSLKISPQKTLLEVLRDNLGLYGVKNGCSIGECGACTILIDNKPVPSCLTLALSAEGKEITTIEGLSPSERLHPLQEAFVKYGAVECGFCTPGLILTAKALLDENRDPSEEEIRLYLRGNLCRCTGYSKIIEAVVSALKSLRKGG
jgi:carbon-monoxide dehydrogenase small subunit